MSVDKNTRKGSSPRGGRKSLSKRTNDKAPAEVTATAIQGKTGRPTDYRHEYDKQAHKLCLLGATNPDLARFFEVAVSTIELWMVKHESFSVAIKGGRQEADAKVAQSLYRRAMGFSHTEEVIMQHKGEFIRTTTRKKYAPDTTAAIFWLKNRSKRDWRDRIEHTGKDGAQLAAPVVIIKPPKE